MQIVFGWFAVVSYTARVNVNVLTVSQCIKGS